MDTIVFLILRRMRAPLLVLIVTYAVTIAGFGLIPGVDAAGNPAPPLSLFHAFYVVSYTATTIGFGEIPEPFSDAQRLWMRLSIYAAVVAWIYSIGTLIALLQDRAFQRAIVEGRFARRVRSIAEPFYLVCGYGETGRALVQVLTDRHRRAVVIDYRAERINLIKIEGHREFVPALLGDARVLSNLEAAGLRRPSCAGVVALTDVNETNLKIAIAAKLLHPRLKTICRAESHDVEANMASFGTDHIYDPFDTFAVYLATALQAPCLVLLSAWLSGVEGEPLKDPIYPPSSGLWVLCGYGRFGKAVYRHLKGQGVDLIVVEAKPSLTGLPPEGGVTGRGTEADTLEKAGIRRAVGLVAGTDDDANNLSILMTAMEMNPRLFTVARENQIDNQRLFEAVGAQIIMHPSTIIAERIRVLLGTPLLSEFETYARYRDHEWACQLISRIAAVVEDSVPEIWQVTIDADEAHAVHEVSAQGPAVTLGTLLRDPRNREVELKAIPLMRVHETEPTLLPESRVVLHRGDRLLFCGTDQARRRMGWTLQNDHALDYARGGPSQHPGPVWAWGARLFGGRHRR